MEQRSFQTSTLAGAWLESLVEGQRTLMVMKMRTEGYLQLVVLSGHVIVLGSYWPTARPLVAMFRAAWGGDCVARRRHLGARSPGSSGTHKGSSSCLGRAGPAAGAEPAGSRAASGSTSVAASLAKRQVPPLLPPPPPISSSSSQGSRRQLGAGLGRALLPQGRCRRRGGTLPAWRGR